jgi:hypothetical protein
MTCFTAHQSFGALDNEAEGDASTCDLVNVMPCFTSPQPSAQPFALDNKVRERKIHREKERERCINMAPLIVSIDKCEYQL